MTDRQAAVLVQELVRAFESVREFVSHHKGLREEECEAVLLCAHELIVHLESHCGERRHQHDTLGKRAA